MKIGILTYHRAHNYGAILQAIAMLNVLRNMGHEVYYIDYWPNYHADSYKLFSKYNFRKLSFVNKIKYILGQLLNYSKIRTRALNFYDAIYNYIEPFCVPFSTKDKFDAIIYGSDQIWRRQITGHYNPVYFANNPLKTKLHISYAASMGKICNDERCLTKLETYFKKFNAVSVRETDLQQLLDVLHVKSSLVLDPTLLLNKMEWNSIIPTKRIVEREYLLFYNLQNNAFNRESVYAFARTKNLEVVEITGKISKMSKGSFSTIGPEEFVSLVRFADFVFTSSFHGLAFAIIYQKQFFASYNTNANRAYSILQSIGLLDRLLPPGRTDFIEKNKICYDKINLIINSLIMTSKSYLSTSLKLVSPIREITSQIDTCTGCFACANICSQNAISLIENKEGFYFPEIDPKKCISCGKCDKICPSIRKPKLNSMLRAYYGWSKDNNIRKNSSSGGLFTLIAKSVLDNDGVVYGSSFNYDDIIRLECHSTNEVDLAQLRRSKYVQSYIGLAYRQIKKDLEKKNLVLFCGTPCQAAGLKSYLQKDFPNLLILDFVCHGVPSMSLLRMHLNYLHRNKVSEIIFRPKNRGWVDDFVIIYGEEKKVSCRPYILDEYFKMFVKYQNLRRSCYKCLYCNGKRFSDITLADFWGAKKYKPEIWDSRGISLMLANTQKGIDCIENLKRQKDIDIFDLPKEYASYVYAVNRTDSNSKYNIRKRNAFINDVYSIGYEYALKKHGYKITLNQISQYKIKHFIKGIIK